MMLPLHNAESATLTVDITTDAVDANPGDGTCATAANACSLRAAIQEANALTGADIITVPGGTFILSIAAAGGNDISSGDLNISSDLTITGSSDTNNPTIIDAAQIDRIFSSFKSETIKLSYLTLQNGKSAPSALGGAIEISDVLASLELENCTLKNNQSNGGGAIYFNSTVGKLTVKQTKISGNSTPTGNEAGGGIFLALGTMEIIKSTIENNATGKGGGLHLDSGNTVITDTTIRGNRAAFDEGGDGGGGINVGSKATLTMHRSLIEDNEGGYGGGIFSKSEGKVIINNSTITNNRTKFHGGGIFSTNNGSVTVSSSTIAANLTDMDADGFSAGGGIYKESGMVILKNSIVANNSSNGNGGDDCYGGSIASEDFNLVESTSGCTITGTTGNNILNQDPILLALADNGGNTKTMALDTGSPVLDKGNTTGCKDDKNQDLTTDQRSNGFTRSADGDGDGTARCDIGAFEVICGDSFKNGNEECDNAAKNSNTVADACRTTCKNPSCGDGTVDTGEGCDDGNNADADGCQANCALPTCGDGIKDAGEQCDDGVNNSNTTADTCRTTCVNAACGDGVADTGEECDDSNASNQDSCLTTCKTATCGDGFVETGKEVCDAGSANSNSTKDACRTTCANAACGDSIVDTGEECDDGNKSDEDECLTSCKLKVVKEESPALEPKTEDPTTTEEPAAEDTTNNDDTNDNTDDVDDTTIDSTETTDKSTSGTGGGCNLTSNGQFLPEWFFLLLIPAIVVCTLRYSFSCQNPISTIDISRL